MYDRDRYDVNTFAGRNVYGGRYGAGYFGRLRYREAYGAGAGRRDPARAQLPGTLTTSRGSPASAPP
ncbi:MAG TPA: hypothetical protein VFL93_02125 [Longimicrobiaceae bacterium]|jgi:hypothetical protein|nr:hypothetical protein [Longimicrobiaceae bacterium]